MRELVRGAAGPKTVASGLAGPASSRLTNAMRPFSDLRLAKRKLTWLEPTTSIPPRSADYWVIALFLAKEARPSFSEEAIIGLIVEETATSAPKTSPPARKLIGSSARRVTRDLTATRRLFPVDRDHVANNNRFGTIWAATRWSSAIPIHSLPNEHPCFRLAESIISWLLDTGGCRRASPCLLTSTSRGGCHGHCQALIFR